MSTKRGQLPRIIGPSKIGHPRTLDEKWYTLLDLSSSSAYPGVYFVGNLARNVTFYSQQVRALNLIDALCNTGRVRSGDRIAIIGAGLAGLTATAAALHRGLRVDLFERHGDPAILSGRMPLQTDCEKRWIDPFVYDWPNPGNPPAKRAADITMSARAGLPVLDWSAGTADEVRRQVHQAFEELIVDYPSNTLTMHQAEITEKDLTWSSDKDVVVRCHTDAGGSREHVVQLVVVAVGFGVEEDAPRRYWTDDGLSGNQAEGKTYLVSGVGDGGLTDVMRLTIANFKHRDALDSFKVIDDIPTDLLKAVERENVDLSTAFLRAAARFDERPNRLRDLEPRATVVYLTGAPDRVFSGKASVLNRLIIAWLLLKQRLRLIDASLELPPKLTKEGLQQVAFRDWTTGEVVARPKIWEVGDDRLFRVSQAPAPSVFADVIVRHGPGTAGKIDGRNAKLPPLAVSFPKLWTTLKPNQRWWRDTPHWLDWTKEPMWEAAAYTKGASVDPPRHRTRQDVGPQLYVAIESAATGGVVSRVTSAARRVLNGNALSQHLDLNEIFKSTASFGRALRTIQEADVAIIDITGLPPEIMFLLGVRAATRRSLTIVTIKTPKEPSNGYSLNSELPYLIRDIHVLEWRNEQSFNSRLRDCVAEGLARAQRLGSQFKDIGVYDAVRNIGTQPEDFSPIPPQDGVLLLATFSREYHDNQGSWLKARFDVAEAGELKIILETPTPELTTAKLYSSLRRSTMCVADWTEYRPNVFFELGVRLSVNTKPIISLISSEKARPKKRQARLLQATPPTKEFSSLFNPLTYNDKGTAETDAAFEDMLRLRKKAIEKVDFRDLWPYEGLIISPDFVSRQMRERAWSLSEDWAVPVWSKLVADAAAIVGPDPQQNPVFPFLFGVKADAEMAALDRLIAAWYFLDRRYRLSGSVPTRSDQINDQMIKEWEDIGRQILLRIKRTGDNGIYAHIETEVRAAIATASTPRSQAS